MYWLVRTREAVPERLLDVQRQTLATRTQRLRERPRHASGFAVHVHSPAAVCIYISRPEAVHNTELAYEARNYTDCEKCPCV